MTNSTVRGVAGPAANARAAAVAEVLTPTVHREQRPGQGAGRASAPPAGTGRGAPGDRTAVRSALPSRSA